MEDVLHQKENVAPILCDRSTMAQCTAPASRTAAGANERASRPPPAQSSTIDITLAAAVEVASNAPVDQVKKFSDAAQIPASRQSERQAAVAWVFEDAVDTVQYQQDTDDSEQGDTDEDGMAPKKRRKKKKKEEKQPESLQNSFEKLRIRKQRQDNLRRQRNTKGRDEQTKLRLREMFVERARHYFGIPYRKKYHEPGTAEYASPLFLDCCGLVRKVLHDLADDLGFSIGPWNQAYMFDLLPIQLSGPEQMKHGDLVFVSAIYNNPKSKQQKHHIVHVEIWAGEEEKTIGARWARGKIQLHDSYQYQSTSYHNMEYHFRSIDTWLEGICKSHCKTHPWLRKRAARSKKSVFYAAANDNDLPLDAVVSGATTDSSPPPTGVPASGPTTMAMSSATSVAANTSDGSSDEDKEEDADVGACEDDDDDDDDGGNDRDLLRQRPSADDDSNTKAVSRLPALTNASGIFVAANTDARKASAATGAGLKTALPRQTLPTVRTRPDRDGDADAAAAGAAESSAAAAGDAACGSGETTKRAGTTKKSTAAATQKGAAGRSVGRRTGAGPWRKTAGAAKPVYCISGGNGGHLVHSALTARGWKRADDPNTFSFKLKWTELKSSINFPLVKPGEQLVNHIPHMDLLTTKVHLAMTLRDYDRTSALCFERGLCKKKPLSVASFLPQTFNMEQRADREAFKSQYKDGEIWICKPSALNQGKGIEIIRSYDSFCRKFNEPSAPGPMPLRPATQHGVDTGAGAAAAMAADVLPPAAVRKKPSLSKLHYSYVMQRYITRPLLLEKCKFDVRCYMLIASTSPFVVMYHHGYVRRCTVPYSEDAPDRSAHLTNQAVQRRCADYEDVKEDTVWSMDQLQWWLEKNWTHPTEGTSVPLDWVTNKLTKRMQEIMKFCFASVKTKLPASNCFFELLGFDFLIDETLKVWLLEVNTNPALHTNCDVLKDLMPRVVDNTLDVVLEVFRKSKRGERMLPLENKRDFTMLCCDDTRR